MKFTVNHGDLSGSYEIAPDDLTFAEARAIAKVTGVSIDKIEEAGSDGIQALAWVAIKRAHPTTTFSDLDDWPMSSITPVEDEPDPTEPGADDSQNTSGSD